MGGITKIGMGGITMIAILLETKYFKLNKSKINLGGEAKGIVCLSNGPRCEKVEDLSYVYIPHRRSGGGFDKHDSMVRFEDADRERH